MPVAIEATTNRLPCNASSRVGVLDMISGEQVQIFKGVPAWFQCALFNGVPSAATYVTDITNINKIDFYVRAGGPNGTILVHEEIDDSDVAVSLYTSWANGSSQQFTFELSETDTNQTLPSDGTLQIYFNVIVTTDDAEYVAAFGYGQLVDAGLTNLGPPVSTPFIGVYTDANGLIQNSALNFTGVTVTGLNYISELDGDLVALAALTGKNTIYYRSDTDTWSPVVIGANLNFIFGTLSATGGGGGGGGGDVYLANENVFVATQTIDTGANGSSLVEGLILRNNTITSVISPNENSPAVVFEAHGYQSLFDSDIMFEMTEEFHVLPDESPPVARFSWKFSENEGAYVEKSYIGSDGSIFGHGYIKTETGFLAVDGSGNAGGLNSVDLYWTTNRARIANQTTTNPLQFLSYNTTSPAWDFYSNGVTLPTGDLIRVMCNSGGATANFFNCGTTTDATATIVSVFKVDKSGNVIAGTYNKVAITAPATGSTITIADGKTFAVDNSIEFSGTDNRKYTFPATNATIAAVNLANTFTQHNTFEGVTATGATGTGNMVFSNAPGFSGVTTFTGTVVEYPIAVANTTITASQGIAAFQATALANGSSVFFVLGRTITAGNCSTFSFTPNATITSNRWSVGFYAVNDVFNVFQSGGASLGLPGTLIDPGAGCMVLTNNFGLGVTAFAASLAKGICIANGTAPSGNIVGVSIWAEGGALKARGALGNVVTLCAA